MSRWVDFLAFLCLTLGMSTLTVAGVLYVRELDAPGIRVEPENFDLGELAANQIHEVEFSIVNPTWHTVRLVGVGHC